MKTLAHAMLLILITGLLFALFGILWMSGSFIWLRDQ